MRGFVPWRCAGVDDIPACILGIEQIGRKTGRFILQYYFSRDIGRRLGEIYMPRQRYQVRDVIVNVEDVACNVDFLDTVHLGVSLEGGFNLRL